MAERWKPNNGEEYFFVVFLHGGVQRDIYLNYRFDKKRWENGNCFKTEAEAEAAAAEKIKDLLLSLHSEPVADRNQLPKLTTEVFNRPDCPEWAKYAAVDEDGTARFHAEEPIVPTAVDSEWWCSTGNDHFIDGKFDASDWQNSLVERHTKLPDWWKVGALVYHKRDKQYEKVTYASEVDFDDSILAEYLPARLRPCGVLEHFVDGECVK